MQVELLCAVASMFVLVIQLFQLFSTPWTIAHQAPPSMGFSRQEYWSGLPFPSPGDLPEPGIEPRSPALQADTLTSEPPGKTQWRTVISLIYTLFTATFILQQHCSVTGTEIIWPANRFISTIFLASIYMHLYVISVFL